MPYQPTEVDLEWSRNVLALIQEGGKMAWPTDGLIYTISHKAKTITLQNPEQLIKQPDSMTTHLRGIEVFRQLGYTVK